MTLVSAIFHQPTSYKKESEGVVLGSQKRDHGIY
uniref:Uncharacterized protein n=1 Tax=Arundo donax TaxID=35708 RepID=A0A0A9A7L4_ARUDO